MILYTHPTLGVNQRWALNDPLTTDMATYLRWFDRPVPGTQLTQLGMMARVFIGILVNQPRRPWGLITELAEMLWDYWQGRFLVDLVREVTTRTGQTAIKLLVLTLACTPLNTLLGFKQALRVRRALGLYAFMYASLHFLTFIWLDYGLDIAFVIDAVVDQRFVQVGIADGLVMAPLAITSTKGWMKRLGKNWKRLHKLTYAAGVLAVLYYLLLVKDIREPMVYAAIVLVLFLIRIPAVRRWAKRTRRRFKTNSRGLVPPATRT